MRLKPIPVEAPQRSDEWFAARLGKVTGSRVSDTMNYYSVTKYQLADAVEIHEEQGIDPAYIEEMVDKYPAEFCLEAGIELQEAAARKSYRENLVGERLTNQRADPDGYVSNDMKWGIVNEQIAVARYQMENRRVVEEANLLLHPDLKCGASPDGITTDLVTGEIGNIEVKCLRSANHLYKIIRDEKVPEDYIPQIQMQMWVSGQDWCDFIGFDSRVPEGLKIFVKRVEYDEFYVDNVLEPAVRRFLTECDKDERFFRMKVREDNAKTEQGSA